MEISSDSRNSIENEEKEENVKPEPVNIDHNNYENEKKDKEIQPQTLKVESISISVSTKVRE